MIENKKKFYIACAILRIKFKMSLVGNFQLAVYAGSEG